MKVSGSALIEGVRGTVSDRAGRYRIVDLPPGAYTLEARFPGFATFQQPGIAIRTGVTTSLDIVLRVGELEEIITVTAEAPVVDVQNSTRVQTVIDGDVVAVLPATRGYASVLAAVPGVRVQAVESPLEPAMVRFSSRGGSSEGVVRVNGIDVGGAVASGGTSQFVYDTANAREIQLTVSGGLGETDRGGPQLNIIPRTGGDRFAGTVFASAAGEWSQGRNLDDEQLRLAGARAPRRLIKLWDTSLAIGGPIVRKRLWFFGSLRSEGLHEDLPGLFGNANAGDPTAWHYEPDESIKARRARSTSIGTLRLSARVGSRHQLQGSIDAQRRCEDSALARGGDQCRQPGDGWVALGGLTLAPESASALDDRRWMAQATWRVPVSDRWLLESGLSRLKLVGGALTPEGALDTMPFVPVNERLTSAGVPVPGFTYHGFLGGALAIPESRTVWSIALSHVTGSHAVKLGYQGNDGLLTGLRNFPSHGLQYDFRGGVPTGLRQGIGPWQWSVSTRTQAVYLQDEWSWKRLTMQGALRYEHVSSRHPGDGNGLLADDVWAGRAFTFPSTEGVRYHDVAPRMGIAIDLFGDGRTAVKATLGRYWQANPFVFRVGNRAVSFAPTTSRAWADANGNFTPDCDLTSGSWQDTRGTGGDFCGPWNNQAFGTAASVLEVNPDVMHGWGVRPGDWQFGVFMERELLPRVSVQIGYSRRTWNNFFYTDNRAVGPEDFDVLTATAPTHARLPTSGQQVSYVAIKPDAFGLSDDYFTFAGDYGDVTAYWQGIDVTASARLRNGLTIQGGLSAGGGVRDTCEIVAALPELLGASQVDACTLRDRWLARARALVAYVVPAVDILVSGIVHSDINTEAGVNLADAGVATNGSSLRAIGSIPNEAVIAALGRPLAGGQRWMNVDWARPGQVYGDRVTNVDLRIAKVLHTGRARTHVGVDAYNLFNAGSPTRYLEAGIEEGMWLEPRDFLRARFFRFNVTVDF